MSIDPEIDQIQTDWHERYRHTTRWTIVADLGGYSVHEHSADGVAPSTIYPTREKAAARLLQLLGLKDVVTPQSWPEQVCISSVSTEPRR